VNKIYGLAVLAVFVVGGLLGLFRPRQVQAHYLRLNEKNAWNPFLPWMRTESYVLTLRLVGVLSLGAAAFGLWAVLFGD